MILHMENKDDNMGVFMDDRDRAREFVQAGLNDLQKLIAERMTEIVEGIDMSRDMTWSEYKQWLEQLRRDDGIPF